MLDEKKIKELVQVSLVCDSYSLGAHWVYDEKQLASTSINWNELNTPLSVWHKGKQAGDFTHYGDQTFFLYEFLKDKDTFDENEYLDYWVSKMKIYNGYIDGASRETLANKENNISPVGSSSHDLSVVGRIIPLLKVSSSKEEFLSNVNKFVKLSHNSQGSINTAMFFAKLLIACIEKKDIESAIIELKNEFDTSMQVMIEKGIASKNDDTFQTIRNFGPACGFNEGFPGIIHLLCKYKNLKDMVICNAKAGGDSSARIMIASAILMLNQDISQVPQNWLNINKKID